MRNLILLIWKYHFFLLFVLFETAAGYLIIQNNNFQKASFINSTNAFVASVLNVKNSITDYFHLKATNEILAGENARLHTLLPEAYYNDKLEINAVRDSTHKQQYEYVSAKVINNSTNKRNNYLTLNKGKLDGVKPEMGVISSGGVVGIVKDVSDHYCSVMSLLHKDFHTSANLKKNNYFGNLSWEGGNPTKAVVIEIPKHVPLAKGDTLVTTTYSGIFPEGIKIGTIDNFEIKPGENFYTAIVNLSTNFYNLSYVYIVNNILKGEQKKLEASSHHD